MNNVRVVVIDDEPSVVTKVEQLARSLGCEVWIATDAVTAVEIVEHNPIDVVLTGVRMPNIDGFVLIHFLRKEHRDVRVIAMSGHSEDRPFLIDALGDRNVLPKPLTSHHLREAFGAASRRTSPRSPRSLYPLLTALPPDASDSSPGTLCALPRQPARKACDDLNSEAA